MLWFLSIFSSVHFNVISQSTIQSDTGFIHLADPTIFGYKQKFYLYGTVDQNAGNGFLVYESGDLKRWTLSDNNDGYALKKGQTFGSKGFWAPQVFHHNGKFYMAYTANENIAIAQSDHPTGPFRQTTIRPLEAPVKQIDPFVFIDDDGRKYLYHVRLIDGNRIFVAEMTDDFSAIKPGTLRECITATTGWENTRNVQWPVAEGPSVFKRKGLYYLFYSANDFRNPDYAVGYATSNHPLGPWKKYSGNPILTRVETGNSGPGHGDFLAIKNELIYVFHTHNGDTSVTPRKTALIKTRVDGTKSPARFVMDAASFRFLSR